MIEPNCRCLRDGCFALLRAVRTGRDVRFIETQTSADGEIALFAAKWFEVVPEFAPASRFTIRATQLGNAARFRDHEKHCMQKHVQPESRKSTRPTGVWNRGPR